MKYFKPLILILLIINFCLSNEYFTPFLLTQNLNSESFPIETNTQKDSTGVVQKRRRRRHSSKPTEKLIPVKPAPRRVTFGILAAEFGGSLMLGLCGAFIGSLAGGFILAPMSGDESPEFMGLTTTSIISAIIGWTFGCAGGTCIVGSVFHQNGHFIPTLVGSHIGLPFLFIGAPFGSVIGYNLSRPKPVKQSFLYQHFNPPSFSFRTEKTKYNKIIPVLDFRLVNTRF